MDDQQNELANDSIVVEDGWITQVERSAPQRRFDEVIDCRRYLAIPGLINAHHHLYQTLTRGFPQSEGKTLFPWLQMLYPIWAGLDVDMVYASTRTGLAELALSGCTTCADHLYVFPDGSDGFIDAQVEAARSVGLRFHATRGSMDLGQSNGGLPPESVVQSREAILRDSERAVQAHHDSAPGAMVRIGLAPCSPFSATPELMLETAGLARELGVRLHTHLAETVDEEEYSLTKFGVPPVELLDRVSWLEEDVWLAHCVHLRREDITRLADREVSVAHCPTSNMLLSSGLAPTSQLLAAGVAVGLGVDGSASNDSNNLRQEIKQAVLSARARDGASALSARAALYLATRGSAQCLGRTDIGCIAPGKSADIILIDVESLECAGGGEDPVAAAVFGAPHVHSVMVHGQFVVRNGELTNCDREEIARKHIEASARLMQKWRDS
jgi:8-oxoguanine deaminase